MRVFPLALFTGILFAAALMNACDSSSSSSDKPTTPVDPNTEATPTADESKSGDEEVAVTDTGKAEVIPELSGFGGTESNPLPLGLRVSRAQLLAKLGDDLSLHTQSFRSSVDGLVAAADQYCTSFSAVDLDAARNQWKLAMSEWQHFEVFQLGPIAEDNKSLKYRIYSWPNLANYCKIDEEVIKSSRAKNYVMTDSTNRIGLLALEYLLFETSLETRCEAGSTVARLWNPMTAEARAAARCAYIKPVVKAVAEQAADLTTRWGVPGNNYLTRAAGDPALEQQALQGLYESFFYVDLEVKNKKMAAPAGLDPIHCAKSPSPCLDLKEFLFSNFSREALDVNLNALIDLFYGPEAGKREGGFSALVRKEGGPTSADRTELNLSEFGKVIEMKQGASLDELIAERGAENCDVSTNSWLCKSRSLIRKLASDLKREYAQVLKVTPPAAAGGDND